MLPHHRYLISMCYMSPCIAYKSTKHRVGPSCRGVVHKILYIYILGFYHEYTNFNSIKTGQMIIITVRQNKINRLDK